MSNAARQDETRFGIVSSALESRLASDLVWRNFSE